MELTQFKTVEQLAAAVKTLLLEDMMANKGWIGGAWQKDPLRIGYSGDKSQQISDTNASAGTNQLTGTVVPAGEIWVVEAVSLVNITKAAVRLIPYIIVNSVGVQLLEYTTTSASEFAVWSGAITLSEGDYVGGEFYSCNAGDDIYLRYHARRIDIDQ